MNEFAQYVIDDIPYEAGAQGPGSYDCMGFFRMIQRDHFGIAVPPVLVEESSDIRVIRDLFNRGEYGVWHAQKKPVHGDMVIVSRPLHIGVWLDIDGGGVMHCVRGDIGVIFTKDCAWGVSGFGRREFYRHESKVNHDGD